MASSVASLLLARASFSTRAKIDSGAFRTDEKPTADWRCCNQEGERATRRGAKCMIVYEMNLSKDSEIVINE